MVTQVLVHIEVSGKSHPKSPPSPCQASEPMAKCFAFIRTHHLHKEILLLFKGIKLSFGRWRNGAPLIYFPSSADFPVVSLFAFKKEHI